METTHEMVHCVALCSLSPLCVRRDHLEPSSGLCHYVTLAPEFPHRKRNLLPFFTVGSSHHKLGGNEKATTAINFVMDARQIRHVRAGVCFRLNTTNNLLWNKEPQVPSHTLVEHPNPALEREDEVKLRDCSKPTPPPMGLRSLQTSVVYFSH